MGRVEHAARAGRSSGRGRVAKLACLAAIIVPLTSGCSVEEAIRFGWPVGVTPQAEAMRELWTWSAIAALAVGVITWGAMFWAMAFHRKRRKDDGTLPRQTQYNLPVEVIFTVVPTVIVAVLFGFTVVVQNYVDEDKPNPDLKVGIEAFQWNWEFFYFQPGAGNFKDPKALQAAKDNAVASTLGTSSVIPIMVLPTDRRIEFVQDSNDVIHSFFVPEFLFKRDVFPLPQVNDQDFVWQIDRIEREGAFVGRCAELCGSYHAFMNFEVRALKPQLFDQWLALRGQVNPDTGAPYSAGEALEKLGCGELCAPQAITTTPFPTEREQRSVFRPATTSGR